VAKIRPRLTIIDTAADVFAGDFMSTPHVRQFIKFALGGLCKRHDTAVLLLAHPSAAAMANGDGAGFSVAWNNSVRSRLYLRRPKTDDAEAAADRRVLEIKKSNYGPTGAIIPLAYEAGRFTLDSEPIDEAARPIRAAKSDTRLSMAVMGYFSAKAASGQVVSFGPIFEALQSAGDIPKGHYDTVRKPLQRTLKDLVGAGLLGQTDVPRGYRMLHESRP
jgi:RecA-family ATPase